MQFLAFKPRGDTSREYHDLCPGGLPDQGFRSLASGIQSIDGGQTEASRSLGMTQFQTMRFIILPQAIKNILPALGNEFIVLLKETSVAGYIALADLTKGGDIIRSQTFSALLPLLAVACIYLLLVIILSNLQKLLERRLRSSEK